jgi:hypothetical protein
MSQALQPNDSSGLITAANVLLVMKNQKCRNPLFHAACGGWGKAPEGRTRDCLCAELGVQTKLIETSVALWPYNNKKKEATDKQNSGKSLLYQHTEEKNEEILTNPEQQRQNSRKIG